MNHSLDMFSSLCIEVITSNNKSLAEKVMNLELVENVMQLYWWNAIYSFDISRKLEFKI